MEERKAHLKLVVDKLTKAYEKGYPFAVVVVDMEGESNNIYLSDPEDVNELAYILYRQAVMLAGNEPDSDLPAVFTEGTPDASQHGPN